MKVCSQVVRGIGLAIVQSLFQFSNQPRCCVLKQWCLFSYRSNIDGQTWPTASSTHRIALRDWRLDMRSVVRDIYVVTAYWSNKIHQPFFTSCIHNSWTGSKGKNPSPSRRNILKNTHRDLEIQTCEMVIQYLFFSVISHSKVSFYLFQ